MKQRSILLVLALAFVLIAQGQTRRQRLPQQAQPQQQVQAQPQQQVLPQQVTQHLTSDNSLDAVEIYQKAKKYEKGKGVEKNLTLAFELYKKAAEMGLDSAQNNLGVCYAKGIGVSEDKEKAFFWYQKSADQGYARAQANLSSCYAQGNGVPMDNKKALEWCQKAAAQGNVSGMMKLAIRYYEGNAVPRDYQKAKELVEQVLKKEKDHKGAKIYLQRINKNLKEQQQLTAAEESVDKNIPVTAQYDENTFAVIIGNEQYAEDVTVPYAEHDAQVFKEYVQRTFGVPEKQINYIENAGLNKIRTAVRWLAKAMEVTNGKGRAIFYYAGHGIPDEASKTAYLLPVDGASGDIESAYPLSKLYQELGTIPSERITVFLDACFNGGKREGDMLASARGVAIKAKSTAPQGKMVIFTAAQGDETAYSFKSQQHGMFTYFLLKKLQDSKGNVTLGDLADYLTSEVKRQSFDENSKLQTPSAIPSQSIAGSWRSMKLK
jgi:TPR repeat protein